MAFAFLIIGAVFITAGVRETDGELTDLIKGDFTSKNGKPSFIAWLMAILLIGALGYIEPIKPVSRAFLVLVVIVLFLSNGGFFEKFIQGTIKLDTSPAGTISNAPVRSLPSGGTLPILSTN
jgi:hypothetical protein